MASRVPTALAGFAIAGALHVSNTEEGLAFVEMGSPLISMEARRPESKAIKKDPKTNEEINEAELAARDKIAGDKKKLKKTTAELEKAKQTEKLVREQKKKTNTDVHMLLDKVKERKDLLDADIDESQGKFKLAHGLFDEADVLKKAATVEATKAAKEQHQIIDTEAQNAAKDEANEGAKQLKGLLIGKLRQEVDAASKSTATKLARKATAKEVRAQQASFESNLTAEVKIGAKKDAKRVANMVVKKALFSKAGLADAVAQLAKNEVEKHSKRYAASEVKGTAGEKASKALDKHTGPAAEGACKKRADQAKQNIKDLHKTQMKDYKRQEKLGKKTGISLIPPATKKEEEEKLLEVLKKQGVRQALALAKKWLSHAAAEHKEALSLHAISDTMKRKAAKDLAAVKTDAEKKLVKKTVDDATAAEIRAAKMTKMTKDNVEKQTAVKLHTDLEVKAYEKQKANKKATAADEIEQNKKALAVAKQTGTKALKAASSSKDKAAAKKHLANTRKQAMKHKLRTAKVNKALADEAANKSNGKPPAKAKTDEKRESEIGFMLVRAKKDIKEVKKDVDEAAKLATADAAQAKIDMDHLKSELNKTMSAAPVKNKVERLQKRANADEKRSDALEKKSKKASKKASIAKKKQALKRRANKAKADKVKTDAARKQNKQKQHLDAMNQRTKELQHQLDQQKS